MGEGYYVWDKNDDSYSLTLEWETNPYEVDINEEWEMKISNVKIFINNPDSPCSLFKKILLKHTVEEDCIKFELSDWQKTIADYHGITLQYNMEESR